MDGALFALIEGLLPHFERAFPLCVNHALEAGLTSLALSVLREFILVASHHHIEVIIEGVHVLLLCWFHVHVVKVNVFACRLRALGTSQVVHLID